MEKPPKNCLRRFIGSYVSGGGGKVGLTYAHALYEVSWLGKDNVVHTIIERGATLRTLPGFQDFNGTKKQRARAALSLRPELESHIRAASVLMNDIEKACMALDDKLREEQ